MPILTLRQHIDLTKEELLVFSPDFVYREGYTGDPDNSANPNSISITNKINQAIADILMDTEFYTTVTTITTAAGTQEYSLPTDSFSIQSVWIGNNRLRRTTMDGLDHRTYNWRSLSGTPTKYYTPSMTSIGLVPNPNAIVSVKVLLARDVALLADVADTMPYISGPYQYLIHIRAALLCAMADTGNEKAQARAKWLQERYDYLIKSLKEELGDRADDDDAPLRLPRAANAPAVGGSQ